MSTSPAPIDPQELSSHLDGMRRLARRMLSGDSGAAEEVAQEAAVRALQKPPRLGTPLGPWLARVTRNLAIDRIRSERRRSGREKTYETARVAAGAGEPQPDVHVARAEAHRRLVDATLALPDPYRTSLVQHYFHGRSAAAIAEELGCTVATVRSHWKRGVKMLRDQVQKEDGDNWRASCLAILAVPRPEAVLPSLLLGAAMLMVGLLHLGAPVPDPAELPYDRQLQNLYELGYVDDHQIREGLGYVEED